MTDHNATGPGWPGHFADMKPIDWAPLNKLRRKIFGHKMRRRIARAIGYSIIPCAAVVIFLVVAARADTLNTVTEYSTNFTDLSYPSTPAVSSNNGGNPTVNGLFFQGVTQSQLEASFNYNGANIPSPYGTTGNGSLIYDYFGGGNQGNGFDCYSCSTNESATFNIGSQILDFLWAHAEGDETVKLFSGANGTGTLLDTISNNDLADNNQNTLAFLVIDDQTRDIGSMTVSVNNGNSGMAFAFDPPPDVVATTPLPGTLIMFLGGIGLLLAFGWTAARHNAA